MRSDKYYFSTRDILMMAAMAALGGTVSTYINAVGDFVQSILGFAGTTQWAAGLHALWLTLAVGLVRKPGVGTVTGILKGAVELLSGNTHGLLVVLVDVVAGVLVDVAFLPFRDKQRPLAYVLAGGLASASNVFVFQLFASLPSDVLTYGALFLVGGIAFLSGVVFAGGVAYGMLGVLERSGVIQPRASARSQPRYYPMFLAGMVLLTGAFAVYLRGALKGPPDVHIGGAVDAPYDYPSAHGDLPIVTAEGTLRDLTTRYTGVPLRALIEAAQPQVGAAMVLLKAADGYAFFVSMGEVQQNDALLLAAQEYGEDATYNIVGAENSKAWVRGVSEITVMSGAVLEVRGALDDPRPFDPNDWQFDMDSISLDVGDGTRKVQGVAVGKVLAAMAPVPDAEAVILHTPDESVVLALEDVLANDDVRIFTLVGELDVSFAVARMNGEVIAPQVTAIEVQ